MKSTLIVATVLVAAALVGAIATPVSAAKNDHRFKWSVEAAKAAHDDVCSKTYGWMRNAEKEADKRAGTKAAEKYSNLADEFWEDGVGLGCSWAA